MKFVSTAGAAAAAVACAGTTACAFRAVPRAASPPPGKVTIPQMFRSSALAKPAAAALSSWAPSSVIGSRRRAASAPISCAAQTSDVAATPGSAETKGGEKQGSGGAHGGKKSNKIDRNSFVQWDMRRAAMKLHTRDQAPAEGKQANKGPALSQWRPTRRGYLQFLVDSKIVYEALEETCLADPRLAAFRDTGLERSAALAKDIAWLMKTYPDSCADGDGQAPSPTAIATEYASFLRSTIRSSLPAFMCHFYNHYFAHTAGGRKIGAKVSQSCLEGHTLEFYKWRSEVKDLLDEVRIKIDDMAKEWTSGEKEECVAETSRTFHYGGKLLSSITS